MRLGGWTRVGIVASVLWVMGAGFFGLRSVDQTASSVWHAQYSICSTEQRISQRVESTDCLKQAREASASYWSNNWWIAIVFILLAIPFAWLFAWIVVRTARWIASGFRKSA